MSVLCLITTCMGRLAHLRQSLESATSQPGCSCVVVDYSCPEHAGDWVEQHYPAVKVVRVPQQAFFNISRARNRGATAADAPWLCFVDADVILNPHFADHVLPLLQPGNFYVAAQGPRELIGTVICARQDFQAIGGYDEVFQSWGGEDRDFYDRLRLKGLQERNLPCELLQAILHGDELRVQHSPVKSVVASSLGQTLYRVAKLDLMKLLGRDLSEPERLSLYGEASRIVQHLEQNSQEAEWRLPFRRMQAITGQEIDSTLVITIRPPKPAPS